MNSTLTDAPLSTRQTKLSSDRSGAAPVLQVRHLEVTYYTDLGRAKALDDVSFSLKAGEKLGMVGESGSGKSTMALAMMRMIKQPGRIEGGQVIVGDTDLMSLDEEGMRKARLSKIAYIPQGAMNSLNPVTRIGAQMVDAVKAHLPSESRSAIDERCANALRSVDLDPGVARMYAHELSGGMKQRVCIAIGILLNPQVIIADEPVSMVDASLRASILETLRTLQRDHGVSIIYITHDLTTAYHIAKSIIVLYRGSVMEAGDVDTVIKDPQHPYTKLLVDSIPWPNLDQRWGAQPIKAREAGAAPDGCPFRSRCPMVMDICKTHPPLFQVQPHHAAACYLYDKSPEVVAERLSELLPV